MEIGLGVDYITTDEPERGQQLDKRFPQISTHPSPSITNCKGRPLRDGLCSQLVIDGQSKQSV